MMILIKRKKDVLYAYEMEAYRRLYAASLDKNGECGNFDFIVYECIVNNIRDAMQRLGINYEDYYCPHVTQKRIINKLLNEDYRLINGSVTYKLKQNEKNRLEMIICLGCSPNTSLKYFKQQHPDYNKNIFNNMNEDEY